MKRHVSKIAQSANFDGYLSASQAISLVWRSRRVTDLDNAAPCVMHICLVHLAGRSTWGALPSDSPAIERLL